MTAEQRLAAANTELLTVYRELTRALLERQQLVVGIADAELAVEDAHKMVRDAHEQLDREREIHRKDREGLNKTFRDLDEENSRLAIRCSELERGLFEIIDDALDLEHFAQQAAPHLVGQ